MMNRGFYNEILTEHNIRPEFKHDLEDANIVLEGVKPNCGDDIWLKLKVEDGIIKDGAFVGDGCAISQASADIMLGMIIGKTKEEALKLGDLFFKMIKGEATDEEIEEYAKKLQALGARNVAVSMAGDGSMLITENGETYRMGVPKGKVVNSVGAGDSMVAGFIASYFAEHDYKKALKYGAATGSATAFSEGLATKDQVEKLLGQF